MKRVRTQIQETFRPDLPALKNERAKWAGNDYSTAGRFMHLSPDLFYPPQLHTLRLEKGDGSIYLRSDRRSGATASPNRGFQPELLGRGLRPLRRSEWLAACDAAAQRIQFRLGLRLADVFHPLARPGQGQVDSQRRWPAVPCSRRQRLVHCQSSACSTRLARRAFRLA